MEKLIGWIRNLLIWLGLKKPEPKINFVPQVIKPALKNPPLRNKLSLKYNCRNCGAPHNGLECEYCMTEYNLPTELEKKSKDGLPVKTLIIVGIVALVGVALAFHIITNKKKSIKT